MTVYIFFTYNYLGGVGGEQFDSVYRELNEAKAAAEALMKEYQAGEVQMGAAPDDLFMEWHLLDDDDNGFHRPAHVLELFNGDLFVQRLIVLEWAFDT